MAKPWLKFNVGISNSYQTIKEEAEKIELAIEEEIDFISQISIERSKVNEMWDLVSKYKTEKTKFASVPLYESVMLEEPILDTIARQYDKGVRSFTLHCTPRSIINEALDQKQNFSINSRGGLFLVKYFQNNPKKENPCLENWTDIQKFISEKGDCNINVGGALRPGCTSLTDEDLYLKDIKFLKDNGLLQNSTLECGGHIKYKYFKKYADLLEGTKISLMGPLITEATNQYDHITNIMGQTLFATLYDNIAGLLILSPAEHLHIPDIKDDRDAIVHAKLCQHYVGLIYQNKSSLDMEQLFRKRPSSCSSKMNLFGKINQTEVCNMCGDFCPLRNITGTAS